MKELLKKFLPKSWPIFFSKHLITLFRKKYNQTWAQCGEHLILGTILQKSIGFYIVIGANNPLIQSNTTYFYNKGWTRINIDATPGSMIPFRKIT